jgi:hypothetical protein
LFGFERLRRDADVISRLSHAAIIARVRS